ncbi:hypothetical protein RclHR1_00080023 [Rhizophagus clarus]|uniref:Phosphatidylglycerol/phosphatidylinositol transfer protein n=1 Tax=Rhizophagus clarus TaxID=94130 RepID=A0A2Z6RZ98_9GLOM|nr:hypothetical protein RclHR1_00080023 [Rhizophagus clarus]GET04054.1 hypothetical protein GLOIN_2v1561294 [Rhizophagus clarus]
MRNHILTNLFVVLIIFIHNNFNVYAEIIIKEILKANIDINDKKLVTRQTEPEFTCYYAIDVISKATDFDIDVPKNAIFTKFTVECNIEPEGVSVTTYSLEKLSADGQWIDMMGVSMKSLGNIGVPSIPGNIIVGSYLLSADPSECLNAPSDGIGIMAKAEMCFSIDQPPEYTIPIYSKPCDDTSNTVVDCPPLVPTDNPEPTPSYTLPSTYPTPTLPPYPTLPPFCYYYTPTSIPSFDTVTPTPAPSLTCNFPTIDSSSPSSFSSFSFLFSFLIVFQFLFFHGINLFSI